MLRPAPRADFFPDRRRVYLTFLRQLQLSPERLEGLAGKVHADLNGVLAQLSTVGDEECSKALAHCFCLIAAADGVIHAAEKQTLSQLLAALNQRHQLQQTEELCERYRKEEGVLGQAMGAVGELVGNAAGSASETMGSALGWVKDKIRKQKLPEEESLDPRLEAGASERESARVLQVMGDLDRQLAAGTISLEAYREQWSQLEQRMQNRPSAQTP